MSLQPNHMRHDSVPAIEGLVAEPTNWRVLGDGNGGLAHTIFPVFVAMAVGFPIIPPPGPLTKLTSPQVVPLSALERTAMECTAPSPQLPSRASANATRTPLVV